MVDFRRKARSLKQTTIKTKKTTMKPNILLLFVIVLFANCQTKLAKVENKKHDPQEQQQLVLNLEDELNALNKSEINSLDQATAIFQKYANKTSDVNDKDALFQPYFMFYNAGRKLLINKDAKLIASYGFTKKEADGKASLTPTNNEYWENNITKHFSEPMKQFCHQQLKEFDDGKDLETVAINAIWWEKFNERNPSFHLKEMTDYHYKYWHLKNLLLGKGAIIVFTKENQLSEEATSVYEYIISEHPQTATAKIVKNYLALLKKNNMQKTPDAIRFFEKI